MNKQNTYSIIVIGTRGSGKTVYLASLFNKLSTFNPDIGFLLKAENYNQRKQLNMMYRDLTSEIGWPEGTKDSQIWNFTAEVDDEPACRFEYLDYAGGLITEWNLSDNGIYRDFLQKADVIMVLLDGEKVLALMLVVSKKQEEHYWIQNRLSEFRNDLKSICQEIQDVQKKGQNKPIHFVITKWDLLEQYEFKFPKVKETILEMPTLNNVLTQIKQKESQSVVRFIPVSSVGLNIAKIDNNGNIDKKFDPFNEPEGFQVEIPLAYVLFDKIKISLMEIEKGLSIKKETIYDGLSKKVNLSPDDIRSEKIGNMAYFVSNISPVFKDRIRSWANSKQENAKEKRKEYYDRQEQLKEEFEECNEKLSSVSAAFKKIVSYFDNLKENFKRKFPDSEIIESDLKAALNKINQRKNQ